MPCHAVPCYAMLCYVMLCYVMLCYVMLCYVMLCYVMYVMLCYVMLCYVMHEQEGVTWEFFPLKNSPPPPTGNYTIWQTFPRKKSHGRTSTGEKQYHNCGEASPSMVDHPPPPPHTHTFLDKGTNTMADCPLGNYTIWQTFPMKEYLMANLPPEEIP